MGSCFLRGLFFCTMKRKVAIQGIIGCNHYIAALNYFKDDNVEVVDCTTFNLLAQTVSQNHHIVGIMAIENTIAGSILPNYQLIRKYNLRIVGEYKLRIKHALVALRNVKLSDIKEINSHPMALMQCDDFLSKLDGVKLVEKKDTAQSAQWIMQNNLRDHAAICPAEVAKLYNMQVLADEIETDKKNYTRFLILIGGNSSLLTDGRKEISISDIDKSSIAFTLSHASGSLSKVLSVLSFYDMNLSMIQSLPIVGREWEYRFYINLLFNDYNRYQRALDAIKPLCREFEILGEYQECILTSKNIILPAERLSYVHEYYFSVKLKEIYRMNLLGGDKVINLGIGSPDLPPSKEAIKALCECAKKEDSHGYQPYTGLTELRKAFSTFYKDHYGVDVDADNEILPLTGSKEGVMHISMAFLNHNDTVLVPNPGYPTYTSVSKLVGANIINYDLDEENNWQPDFNALESANERGLINLNKVKLMWCNYSNMPTGAPATLDLYKKLIAFGKRHNIIICHDNPYSFILNSKPISILSVPGAKEICIELNSMSKTFNMPGWRIGVAVSCSKFINWMLMVKSNMDSGMFKAMQMAAIKSLQQPDSWFSEINDVYLQRRDLAKTILESIGCDVKAGQQGMFLWGKIIRPVAGSETDCISMRLSDEILHRNRVFITPGCIFGSNGDNYMRISLCCKEEILREAIDKIN